MRSFEDDIQIEEAIKYLAKTMGESGNNPKPVILHSTRMAVKLYNLDYATDIVIAAFLHDLLEDSAADEQQISAKFGSRVVDLVKANTFDESIVDQTERYKESFSRLLAAGEDAVIIKAVDILDNSAFYSFKSGEKDHVVLNKLGYFLNVSEKILKDNPIYQELESRYKKFLKHVS